MLKFWPIWGQKVVHNISRISREKWVVFSRISREIKNARNVHVYIQLTKNVKWAFHYSFPIYFLIYLQLIIRNSYRKSIMKWHILKRCSLFPRIEPHRHLNVPKILANWHLYRRRFFMIQSTWKFGEVFCFCHNHW